MAHHLSPSWPAFGTCHRYLMIWLHISVWQRIDRLPWGAFPSPGGKHDWPCSRSSRQCRSVSFRQSRTGPIHPNRFRPGIQADEFWGIHPSTHSTGRWFLFHPYTMSIRRCYSGPVTRPRNQMLWCCELVSWVYEPHSWLGASGAGDPLLLLRLVCRFSRSCQEDCELLFWW